MSGYESLHNHTIDSDGSQNHLEILATAEQLGYGVIAFTDHDLVPKPNTVKQLKDYQGPVKWLVGTELSSGLPEDMGGVERGLVHILGLFVDPTNQPMVDHLQKLESSRVDRMKHMVEHLQSIGFKISISDVQAAAGDSIIGSPHIVKAVQKHPENLALEKELLAKMKEQAKTSEDVKAKFEQMVEAGIVQYPYRLYMKASSFIPMPRAESYTALLSLEDSVDLIHQAGGVAVLAHWYFHTTIFKAARLEEAVGAGKLDGLETSTDNTTFDGDVTSEVEMLRRLIEKYQLAEVMGSDSHSVEDLAAFAKGPNAELSVGHTQKIIDKFKPNLEWSNF